MKYDVNVGDVIDHINRIKTDNRISNLRLVTNYDGDDDDDYDDDDEGNEGEDDDDDDDDDDDEDDDFSLLI